MRILLALAALLAQETRDNPQYEYWKDCKPGSWIKVRMEMTQGGQKMEMTITYTLTELTAEKALVEQKGVMKAAGQERPMNRSEEIPAKKEKLAPFEKKGEEEIEVAGKKLKCQILLVSEQSGDGNAKVKTRMWLSKEIPGGMAKGDFTPEGAEKPAGTLTALEWEKK